MVTKGLFTRNDTDIWAEIRPVKIWTEIRAKWEPSTPPPPILPVKVFVTISTMLKL